MFRQSYTLSSVALALVGLGRRRQSRELALSPSSPGMTLTVDGKPLIQDGKLLLPEQVAAQ